MPRYTGPESLQQVQAGVAVRLDDGGKLDFEPENGRFRLHLVSPRGVKHSAALFTAERLRNIGAALIALATGEPPADLPKTSAEATSKEDEGRFTLLEID